MSTTVAKAARAASRIGPVLLLGVLAGCGSLSSGADVVARHAVPLPTHNFSAQQIGEVASGGRIAFDGVCVSLDYGDGTSTNLIWPLTFHAEAPPLMIFGASGHVVIREGDEVELGVRDANRPVVGCPPGGAFLVGDVLKVNGAPFPDGTPAPPPVQKPPPRLK